MKTVTGGPDIKQNSFKPHYRKTDLAMEEEVETLKVVVVGDVGVGKSSLLITHTTRIFPEAISTVVDTFETQLGYMNRLFSLDIYDTAGSPDLSELRQLSYANTDVFVLCYSIISESSFQSCFDFWKKEIEKNVSGGRSERPIVLFFGNVYY